MQDTHRTTMDHDSGKDDKKPVLTLHLKPVSLNLIDDDMNT